MSFNILPPLNDRDEKRFVIAVRILFGFSILITLFMSYYIVQNMKKVDYYTYKQNNYITTTSTLYEIRSLFYKIAYDIQYNTANHYFINQDIALLEKAIHKFDTAYKQQHSSTSLNKNIDLILNKLHDLSTLHNSTLIENRQPINAHNMVANINNAINSLLEESAADYSSISSFRSHYTSQNQGFYILNLLLAFGLLGASYIIVDHQFSKNRYYKKLLLNRVDKLKAKNIELEQYSYITSHDLQEPTRKIVLLCDRVLEKSPGNISIELMTMIKKIRRSAQRMNSLVDDLLLFSKISNTKFEKQEVNLNVLLESVINDSSDIIKEKNAMLFIELLPTLPLHESQVYQLFSNLISNSLKYAKQDISPIIKVNHVITKGKDISFTSISESEILFSKISISDNGIGFNQEHAGKIFQPFQRLHNSKEYTGTGIGLAICEKVVKNHNGYIDATGNPDEGANFSVYFPHL